MKAYAVMEWQGQHCSVSDIAHTVGSLEDPLTEVQACATWQLVAMVLACCFMCGIFLYHFYFSTPLPDEQVWQSCFPPHMPGCNSFQVQGMLANIERAHSFNVVRRTQNVINATQPSETKRVMCVMALSRIV